MDAPRREAQRGGLTPPTNAPDLSIERDVVRMAFYPAVIRFRRRLMIGRRAFGMFPREGRRRCHKRHNRDGDQRSHLISPADFLRLANRGC
jgi:hypothetical protein